MGGKEGQKRTERGYANGGIVCIVCIVRIVRYDSRVNQSLKRHRGYIGGIGGIWGIGVPIQRSRPLPHQREMLHESECIGVGYLYRVHIDCGKAKPL